jgi:phosphatidylinositol 4-kinase
MQPKYKSYQTVANKGGSIASRRNFAVGRNLSLPLRKQLEVRTNGSDIYDDDENDYSEHDTNGNVNYRITPNSNGNFKPPPSSTKPPPVVFKENWKEKEERLRSASAYGNHPGWKLLPVLVKSNDDLRQEQLASQLIQRMALILARDKVSVWLCPYEILALDASGGIIEAIPDTISLASLKKNDPDYTDLKGFFEQYFHQADTLADAKANFCESLAAYSMVCFLLQIKDRHNGNILLDNRGHLIHIDFGFFFLSSPGKNTGFESAPFKLTREFVNLLGGPDSHLFGIFRTLCHRTFLSLRKHCHEIILLVEMLQLGNEELACFRGRPDDAIRELRQRFRLDLNDRACLEYVNALIEESLENWRTNWYDRYQRYCVGVL